MSQESLVGHHPSASRSPASMKSLSPGFHTVICPQMEGMTRQMAYGMLLASNSLSAGGKYRSCSPGMITVRALIDLSAATKSPPKVGLSDTSPSSQVRNKVRRSLASEWMNACSQKLITNSSDVEAPNWR